MKKRFGILCLLAILVFTMSMQTFAVNSDDGMRGVWVSSVYNLDYPQNPTTDATSLKKQADEILNDAQDTGFNAIFLQVRPTTDALYPSEIYPYSKYLTGTVGVAPSDDFDVLRYFIDEAHARGIELHAWINPYRITKGYQAEYDALPESSPAKQNPEWVVKHTDGNYYFDPAIEEVRELVINGVVEILENYPDIDGIHMDDYFYPGTDFDDSASFEKYGSEFDDIGDFRRENVNILVRDMQQAVAQQGDYSFGISPSGIWDNKSSNSAGSETSGGNPSYSKVYADTVAWVNEGIVDYICPQLYWYIGQSAADYEILVDWWSDVVSGTDVDLYIGMAAYKVNDASQGENWQGTTEIINQLKLNDTIDEIDGHIFFRSDSFNTSPELAEDVKAYYNGNIQENNDTQTEIPPATDSLPVQIAKNTVFDNFLMLLNIFVA